MGHADKSRVESSRRLFTTNAYLELEWNIIEPNRHRNYQIIVVISHSITSSGFTEHYILRRAAPMSSHREILSRALKRVASFIHFSF